MPWVSRVVMTVWYRNRCTYRRYKFNMSSVNIRHTLKNCISADFIPSFHLNRKKIFLQFSICKLILLVLVVGIHSADQLVANCSCINFMLFIILTDYCCCKDLIEDLTNLVCKQIIKKINQILLEFFYYIIYTCVYRRFVYLYKWIKIIFITNPAYLSIFYWR